MKIISPALGLTVALIGIAPAMAAHDVENTIDPDTLPPRLRQQAMTAPLGFEGPFGEPTVNGCSWSRIQVPTSQGLRWILEKKCLQGSAGYR